MNFFNAILCKKEKFKLSISKELGYVLTGAPGSGKTAVILELAKRGHAVIHEAATAFIREEQMKGLACPWRSADFIDNVIAIQIKQQLNATGALQFYDRSPFCTYALHHYLSQMIEQGNICSELLLKEIERCLNNYI